MALSLPVIFFGLIDPLEGGVALLLAFALLAPAFFILRDKPIRFFWISFLVSVLVGGLTITFAVLGPMQLQGQPMSGGVIVGLWLYRVAVLSTLVAAVMNFVKLVRNR